MKKRFLPGWLAVLMHAIVEKTVKSNLFKLFITYTCTQGICFNVLEEKVLRQDFKEAYQNYCIHVRRWL